MSEAHTTVWENIRRATAFLQSRGVSEAFASARVLMAAALDTSSADVVVRRAKPMTREESERFWELIERRASGEPVAYILGRCEFYSIELEVERGVFIPRPETEHLVEVAIELARTIGNPLVLDVGTGSGCVAIALAKHVERARVVGTDVSHRALACAGRNAERCGVSERTAFVRADVAACFGQAFDLVVCNPPYVADAELAGLPPEVREYQPADSLAAGENGLDFIRRVLRDAHAVLVPHGYLAFEIGDGQKESASSLAESAGWKIIDVRRDLAGVDRVIVAQRG